MTDAHRGEEAPTTPFGLDSGDPDDLILDLDEKSGVGHVLLKSLPYNAVVAYRGEPTASERAMLSWHMTDKERYEFAASVERVSNRLRHMTQQETEDFLTALDEETRRLNLDLEIRSEDVPGSQDGAAASPAAEPSANPSRHSGSGPLHKLNPTRFLPGLLARRSGRVAEG
ncbi:MULTISPECIES: hypothetical protein [Micromonospora]|uniref:hypothetical protein n=1 Tax=Micromonospora TaxID=1873 RepID=UPI001153E0F7|nr:hypothetical protein [Micromonospora sp. A202]TQJ21946.1 hypothetical protein FBZ33_2180 [Micromonospora sp. A202]WTI24045.1 hypothetical protein OG886_13545 [Micromonospora zamorensis]